MVNVHPVLAFSIVGLGASAYAPAKYGLVTELVPAERLVAANGWLEVSVVCAALLGTGLGGLLVSPWLIESAWATAGWQGLDSLGLFDAGRLTLSLLGLLLVYGMAGMLNLGVPASGARYPAAPARPIALTRDFWRANLTLWRDREGGLSLAVTTIFWGVGATLQFAVLRWAADQLGLPLNQAAYLQAAVAMGVVAGAAIAGRWVPLLAVAGLVGGLLVVPLNALLQHRGCLLLSAGRSIAVQGFNEIASVLAMLAGYAVFIALDVPIVLLLWGLGVSIAAAMGLLIWRAQARDARMAADTGSADGLTRGDQRAAGA